MIALKSQHHNQSTDKMTLTYPFYMIIGIPIIWSTKNTTKIYTHKGFIGLFFHFCCKTCFYVNMMEL